MQVKSIAEWEHSAILSTLFKLPFSIQAFVLSILRRRLRQLLLYEDLIVLRQVRALNVLKQRTVKPV